MVVLSKATILFTITLTLVIKNTIDKIYLAVFLLLALLTLLLYVTCKLHMYCIPHNVLL